MSGFASVFVACAGNFSPLQKSGFTAGQLTTEKRRGAFIEFLRLLSKTLRVTGSAKPRVAYLDGVRGTAISLVIAWHYWGPTYADHLPFGYQYQHNQVVGHGWVGVELFFLLSGYVIFVTIERCQSCWDFLWRRFTRLFPAMLVTTILIFAFRTLVHKGTTGRLPNVLDTLPGLTFISPAFFHAALGVDVSSLDDVFWTLYVEIAFYITFAALYFRLGWQKAVIGLIMGSLLVTAARSAVHHRLIFGMLARLPEPFEWAGVPYFSWFASGILFAKAADHDDIKIYYGAIAAGATAIAFQPNFNGLLSSSDRIALSAVLCLFALAQRLQRLQLLLSWRPLTVAGLISYPLYLVHNNIGFSFTILTAAATSLPRVLTPVPGLLICTGIAWALAAAEPSGRLILDRLRDGQILPNRLSARL